MEIGPSGQQALDLMAKTFINPGDTVITEARSYTGALNAFKAYEANIIGIPVGDRGIDTNMVEGTLNDLTAKKIQVKFIYVVSNFAALSRKK